MTTQTFTRVSCPLDGRWGPGLTVCKHAEDLPPTKLFAVPKPDGSGLSGIVCASCLTGDKPVDAMTDDEILAGFRLVCRCPRCSDYLDQYAQPPRA